MREVSLLRLAAGRGGGGLSKLNQALIPVGGEQMAKPAFQSCVQGYLAHKKTAPPPTANIGP